jgi:hypothetical protein
VKATQTLRSLIEFLSDIGGVHIAPQQTERNPHVPVQDELGVASSLRSTSCLLGPALTKSKRSVCVVPALLARVGSGSGAKHDQIRNATWKMGKSSTEVPAERAQSICHTSATFGLAKTRSDDPGADRLLPLRTRKKGLHRSFRASWWGCR